MEYGEKEGQVDNQGRRICVFEKLVSHYRAEVTSSAVLSSERVYFGLWTVDALVSGNLSVIPSSED